MALRFLISAKPTRHLCFVLCFFKAKQLRELGKSMGAVKTDEEKTQQKEEE